MSDRPAFNERTPEPLGRSMSLNGDPVALAARYAEWAEFYDADVGPTEIGHYGLPLSVLQVIDAVRTSVPKVADPDIEILDAGCGTGRVGMALAGRGYTTIDGIDLSPEMVDIAMTRNVYRRLEGGIDLTLEPSQRWRASADLVVVGGVFTVGHLRPEALLEVAKLCRPGGVLVTTVRPGYYDTTDYGEISRSFAASDAADLLVEFDDLPYTADTNGRYYGYRIN